MKKISIIHYSLLFLLLLIVSSCREEGADLRPGLYVDTELVDAFPGKEVTISGQASCYTGFESVSFVCDAWKISQVDELKTQKPVVWNFSYSFTVPQDAEFPQELLITATDVHGTQMKKSISVRYAPATTPPYIDGLKKQIAVDFDEESSSGECQLKATLYGEDMLKSAVVEIPSVSYSETFVLSKREEEIVIQCKFDAKGTYPMTITVTDNSENTTVSEHKLIVMKPEQTDEIKDYPYMWVFTAGADESQYLYGFYQYLNRQDSYQYEVFVYAPSDETAFFFTPTRETNGERLFGESPYVEDRIISMQSEPGYVKGYKPGKGYWGLWIDIKEKSIRKWSMDCSEARSAQLYIATAEGLLTPSSFFTPMEKKGETIYQNTLEFTLTPAMSGQWFTFTENGGEWDVNEWRPWFADGDVAGWYFKEKKDGNDSGTMPTVTTDTDVTMRFDAAIKWCWIIKK